MNGLSPLGKVTGKRERGREREMEEGGQAVEEGSTQILMKLQNGLIDLSGCTLPPRDAVKTDASRLVSEEPLKDNEIHCQET